jgi:RNA polymerase sigma-70 factor (family 1)
MVTAVDLQNLVHRIASDDPIAYKELFLLYQPRLVNFSCSIIHTREPAEEIVSDIFLKIWVNRKNLHEILNLHLYLYISTKNASINYVLQQKKKKYFSLDETIVELRSIYYDPEELMITAEMLKRIQQAIQQLPPKCRLIFKLVKEDSLKYKEVAELLHLSVKTVEAQMTIALRKMHASIQFNIEKSFSSN